MTTKNVPVPVPPPPALPTLAEQKLDFTAEGAPPPGKVHTSAPVTTHDAPPAVPPKHDKKTRRARRSMQP